MVKNKEFKIGLISVLAVLAASLIVNFHFNNERYALIESEGDLRNQLTTLQSDFAALNVIYEYYLFKYHHSDLEYNFLQSEYQSYKSNHGYSNSDYESLNTSLNKLKIEYQLLSKIYEETDAKNIILNATLNELLANCEEMEARIAELELLID